MKNINSFHENLDCSSYGGSLLNFYTSLSKNNSRISFPYTCFNQNHEMLCLNSSLYAFWITENNWWVNLIHNTVFPEDSHYLSQWEEKYTFFQENSDPAKPQQKR